MTHDRSSKMKHLYRAFPLFPASLAGFVAIM
jgi:hypothetical protein